LGQKADVHLGQQNVRQVPTDRSGSFAIEPDSSRRVYEFSTLHVDNRIQAEVLRLGNRRVSTHREVVTRELTRLTRIGIVKRSDDALLVSDVERLTQMVQDATGE
jgi:CRP/FNR family transcriptional regulator, cyclic AMP receptor protein